MALPLLRKEKAQKKATRERNRLLLVLAFLAVAISYIGWEQDVQHFPLLTADHQHEPAASAAARVVTPVPSEFKNNFYVYRENKSWLANIIKEHLRRGHREVHRVERAHYVWKRSLDNSLFSTFQPWQRHNHIPGGYEWDNKAKLVQGMRDYYNSNNKGGFRSLPPYMPQTYQLRELSDVQALLQFLETPAGKQKPFVLKDAASGKGKGVRFLSPNSDAMQELKAGLQKPFGKSKYTSQRRGSRVYVLQEYICNGFLYNKRKGDLRMMWLVASIEPLVALMRPAGLLRVAAAEYDETNLDKTESHITNLSAGGSAHKWEEFVEFLREHHKANRNKLLGRGIKDPLEHVVNQMKAILAHVVQAYRYKSFGARDESPLKAENGFANIAADFYVDNDLDVFLIELQQPQELLKTVECCGFGEYISDMINVVEKVHEKQSRGQPILPLDDSLGNFELIYYATKKNAADTFQFTYNFQKVEEKKGCQSL